MRLRTQRELMEELRTKDPETALTPHALRRMVLSGQIPTIRSGRRYLIDLDRFEEYLQQASPGGLSSTGIREVKENYRR